MIYCPNCGIANRDGSRFCNDCGTKLPTATGQEPDSAASEPGPSAQRDLSLPAHSEAAAPEPAPSPVEAVPEWMRDSSSTEQPEWLQRLAEYSAGADRSEDQPAAGETAPAATSPDNTAPDWLSSLRATPPTEPPASSIEPPAISQAQPAGESHWPSNLRAARSAPIDSESPAEPIQADETPDWLKNLSAGAAMPSAEPAASETPDWLSNLGGTSAPIEPGKPSEVPAPEPGSSASEIPEWLSQLTTPAPDISINAIQGEDAGSPETPDWVHDLSGAATPSQEPVSQPPAALSTGSEMPDWVHDLGGTATPSQKPRVEGEQSEVPDWLRDLDGAATSQEPVSEPPAALSTGAEMPEWLRDLSKSAAPQETAGEPEQAAVKAAESEMPDWLRDLRGSAAPQETAGEPEQAAASAAETEMPDWLRDLRKSAASQEIAGEPEQAAASSAETEMPDWLRDVDSTPADSTAAPAPAAAPWSMPSVVPIEEPAEALPPAEPATELPDWLSALQPAGPMTSSQLDQPAQPSSTRLLDQPAAKIEPAIKPIEPAKPAGEFEPATPAAKPGSGAQITPANELPMELREEPEAAADLPDWLQAMRKDAPAAAVSNLAQGDIPDWLQALRPADEGLSEFSEESHEAEQEGVLAGIAHTLPAVPLISEVHGLPTNLKVETSAQDLAHAGLLQELLAGGAAATKPTMIAPGAGAGARLRRRVGQVVVAAIILLAVSVPAWVNLNQALGFNLLPRVETLPNDSLLRSASNTIDQLPEGASALVIFDYDPTQAGEMNPIADVMVRHLIRQGVNIKTASLNPLGSSLARGVWLRAGGQITGSASFTDLGYVAGQSIGVQQLLANNSSSNVVIDLAASSDSVRWWVEQITTLNSPAPLVVGLSASAAPLVLPYVRSGQVKGMVTGMVGALMYAQHAGLAPLSNTDQLTEQQIHLEAQTLAQWVMALIILIGMLSALFSRGGRRSTV